MRQVNIQVLSGDDSGSVTGGKVDSQQLVSASFQAIFGDASAAGTVKVQASNDISTAPNYLAQDFTPTNWSDIPNATSSIASGVGPMIIIANMSYRWIRAVYTRSGGGTTTVAVNMNALGI